MDGANGSAADSTIQTDSNGSFELSVHNYGIHALKLDYLGLSSISSLFISVHRKRQTTL